MKDPSCDSMKLGFLDMSAAAPHDGVEYILTMKYVILYSSTVKKNFIAK